MKVFNLYLKLLKSYLVVIIVYVAIFLGLATFFFQSDSNQNTGFSNVKINISFISEDDSILISGLKSHLSNYVIFNDIQRDEIDDAVYFEQIFLAILIPEGFTDKFLNNQDPIIDKISNPQRELYLMTVNQAINSYLNLVKVYKDNTDMDLPQILESVSADLEHQIDAEVVLENDSTLSSMSYFFNYLSYIITAIMITIIGMIMLRFKNIHLKRRLDSSPYPEFKTNLEMTLGHSFLAISFFTLLMILSYIFYPDLMLTNYGLLFMVNTLAFVVAAIAIGYLIGLLVNNDNTLSAAGNIIALGTAFLTGAFVPQFLLGKGILAFAHLFPSYYFINNNFRISGLTIFNWESLKQIYFFIGVQILFAIVLFIGALLIRKKQATREA